MSSRSCADCRHLYSWQEYGNYFVECGAKPTCESAWYEHLTAWDIDPGPYCNQYEYIDWQAVAQAHYESVVESERAAEDWRNGA